MKIAELIIDKKGIKKIILFFVDSKINTQIRKIKSAMYYQNHKQWVLLDTDYTRDKLKKLDFLLVKYEKKPFFIKKNMEIFNNFIKIDTNNDKKYQIIKNFTHFDTKNCMNFRKFDFNKAKRIEFFKIIDNYLLIPIGLKQELQDILQDCVFTDKRKIKKFKYSDDEIKNCLGYLELYDEQIEAVKSCFKNTNGIIDLIGGLGKTEIILSLCRLVNVKTLILTESIDIARQTYERALNAKLQAALLQGDNVNEDQITIATIQSSHKLKQKYEMVLIDEVHNVSEQYIKILQKKEIIFRFGFSASVFGKDKIKNLTIKQFIGDVIYTKDNQELIDEKKVAKPNFNIIEINKPNLQKFTNWKVIEKLGIIQNNYRNEIILKLCQKFKKQTLILIKKIEHGEEIKTLLESNNIKCIFLQGKNTKQERKEVLQQFEKNNNDFILIGSTILKEGVSINAVFNLIYAGAGSSFVDTLQSIFRGTRIKLKDEFKVYDFYDKFNPITLKHSKQRIKLYKEKIYDNIKYLEI